MRKLCLSFLCAMMLCASAQASGFFKLETELHVGVLKSCQVVLKKLADSKQYSHNIIQSVKSYINVVPSEVGHRHDFSLTLLKLHLVTLELEGVQQGLTKIGLVSSPQLSKSLNEASHDLEKIIKLIEQPDSEGR